MTSRALPILFLLWAAAMCAGLCACDAGAPADSVEVSTSSSQAASASGGEEGVLENDDPAESAEPAEATASIAADTALAPLVFPTCWLAVDAEGIPAGTAITVEYLPELEICARRDGVPASAADMREYRAQWDFDYEGLAVVAYGDVRVAVDPAIVLVNLPDVLDAAVFDVVYAYASTSAAAGREIPGVTGCRLDGYADGKQENAYLGKSEFSVPCAYGTELKVRQVARVLSGRGYRLLVYDAYRPMEAQMQLSEAFQLAYDADPQIQRATAGWGTAWYVAPGASGHNYGTDIDVGLCDEKGNPLPMPSATSRLIP